MRIAIVGLGAAGCRAAMLLREKGMSPDLYEARDRVGGRLETVRLPGGGFYDAGGEWLDGDHHRVLNLIRELGSEPELSNQWPGRMMFRDESWPENNPPADIVGAQTRLEDAVAYATADLEPAPWENLLSFEADETALSHFLDRHCEGERDRWAIEATTRSDEGDDSDQLSLLGWLCGQMNYDGRGDGDMSAYRFPDGGQAFCESMLEKVGLNPRLNTPLRRIERTADEVHLVFDDFVATYDQVILTLPPPALRRIEFDPELSPGKEMAIEESGMGRAIKVSLEFSTKFWSSPRVIADQAFQQVWDGGRGDCAILNAYVCGRAAEDLLSTPDPVAVVLASLESAHPGATSNFKRGAVHDWIGDPWAGGAFYHIRIGQALGGMRELVSPEGGLHFAGEHTSQWLGFVEGALESAERVVSEVLLANRI